MEKMLLKDQQVKPTEEFLEISLGKNYPVYRYLMDKITAPLYGLVPQWNYYQDGKAWLCKACFKKKTVFWISVWDSGFKTAFYFTDKNSGGVVELDIKNDIKEHFLQSKHIGKLIPLVQTINSMEQIGDLLKIIDYKKSLK